MRKRERGAKLAVDGLVREALRAEQLWRRSLEVLVNLAAAYLHVPFGFGDSLANCESWPL